MFIKTLEKDGQRREMLIRASCLFRLLKALEASTIRRPWDSGSENKLLTAWIADSQPPDWPAHNCTEPAASWMSKPITQSIANYTSMGRTPGFLSRAISRLATKVESSAGSTYSEHNLRATAARAEQSSSGDLLKQEQRRLHSAASTPEGPADPRVHWATD